MLGSPAGPGGPPQRGLWPLAPAPTATSFSAEALGKYGVYSLFPGGPTFGSALYSHASTIGRFASGQFQQTSGNTFHATHKDSLFSSTGYTFGAPTPPPGSPYSPIPVAQLELFAKGYTNSNIIIQQPADFPPSPKKIQEKRCDEKCCNLKTLKSSLDSPVKYSKVQESTTGCSRTNPIEWSCVNVKKEPGATPCQVAEITTSVSPVVKLEIASPTQKNNNDQGSAINMNGGSIPVGIAVARQRVQQEVVAQSSLPPDGLLAVAGGGSGTAQIKEIARISEIDNADSVASMAAANSGAGQQGGTLLQCTEDRSTALAAWQMGSNHNQALATPTLWQYPAPVPMEPMVPLPVPMPPVGFQLVRDPTTGGLLLLPTTTGIEPIQQTVVWPSYHQPSSVLLPSIPPMPPPPLQLLSSTSSDYLASSTTLHQHTQTHSTRLVAVTTDTKRKIPMPIPATTLIKIETDAGTMDQTKTLQAVSTISNSTGTVFTDPNMAPLVTTHVIYQHPTNLILSQTQNATETICKSQATSPVATCLTPPPEILHSQEEEPIVSAVQDASNQTDTPICSEDDNTIADVVGEDKSKEETTFDSISLPSQDVFVPKTPVPEIIEAAQTPMEPEVDSTTFGVVGDSATCDQTERPEAMSQDKENLTEHVQKPDLSGLELLSNSIVEFENCRNNSVSEIEDTVENNVENVVAHENVEIPVPKPVEDTLGGLDLLCALAEQRIMEEKIEKPKEKKRSKSKERRREKRKSRKHSSDEPRRKKMKSDKREDRAHRKREKRSSSESEKRSSEKNEQEKLEDLRCSCKDKYRSYKTPESEEEVKKFIASKSQQICCKGEWPCMNAMELDMRMKLAELQRQYREKQKELSKLKPKKHHYPECSKKKSRKKSSHSERSLTPPPQLEKMDVPVKQNKNVSDLLRPPTLCAISKVDETYKSVGSDLESSPEKYSSSKKRKVGRPKKLMSSPGKHVATETIVAKKPKSSFVGYLLAAKEKLKLQSKVYPDSTPPRFVEETYTHKLKRTKNNNILSEDIKSSKIRPKLKAEATIKTYEDDELNEWLSDEEIVDHIEEDIEDEEEPLDENPIIPYEVLQNDDNLKGTEKPQINVDLSGQSKEKIDENVCALTAQHLEMDKLRVLTAMGGLFYAGRLNAVEPPDVYSITLDGERGNRPHIMSREEILRDAIVEVSPKSTLDLPVGTRLCAYWSQQYRCLYPGSVAEPGTPDPQLDGKFVSVEFDDGDSGRIAIEDIRLLPPNYPIIEYDPNPLLSLCKRRRRTSTSASTEEKRLSPSQASHTRQSVEERLVDKTEDVVKISKENQEMTSVVSEKHKEKRRLKKKKREKLRQKLLTDREDRKKKKKHKCTEENCKHKKHHKKHRKHRKHHEKQEETAKVVDEVEEMETSGDTIDTIEDIEEEESSRQEDSSMDFPEYHIVANPEDEVTMDDILEANQKKNTKKIRDRQESCESRSKMSAFLPARQFWSWSGKGYKRQRAKGRSKKSFYKSIQRGKETITVGDSAVFLSTGRPDRPYIGRIEAMWELCGTMIVKVKWFYHPEETVGCPMNLKYPGALFESPHVDENDVQTISHKCEVLPLTEYVDLLGDDPQRYATIYDNNDIYYLAGYYDPTTTTIKMEPGIPFTESD